MGLGSFFKAAVGIALVIALPGIGAGIAAGLGATGAVAAAITLGTQLVGTAIVSSLFMSKPEIDGAGSASQQVGNRVQLPASTTNQLPMVYGSAWMKGMVVDARIASDKKTMWYVLAFSEVSDQSGKTPTFGTIKWNDKVLKFDTTDKTKVVSWRDNDDTSDDTAPNGKIHVYRYIDGSNSPQTGTPSSAITVLQDSRIEEANRWTSTDLMSKTAFLVIRVDYDQNAQLTGLGTINAQLTCPITVPGDVFYDYLTNTRYGCAVPTAHVDGDSITALNNYSVQPITYTDTTNTIRTQNRYSINGPVLTSATCFNNLQTMADACDSWVQWNEATAKWGVVINRSYTQAAYPYSAKTLTELYELNDDNVIGSIDLSPVDLNSTINRVEASYPDPNIYDQAAFTYIDLDDADKNSNEPDNILNLRLPLTNNNVMAKYIATRKLIQAREDLYVTVRVDHSGIQIDAGDVVRFNNDKFKWVNKLFRVIQVSEEKSEDGSLTASLQMIEYNDQVYQNINISEFIPSPNTGLTDPNRVTTPNAPTITDVFGTSTVPHFTINAVVPSGVYKSVEFYYSTDGTNYQILKSEYPVGKTYYTSGETVSSVISGLPSNNYYFKVLVVTPAGRKSPMSPAGPSNLSIPWAWAAIGDAAANRTPYKFVIIPVSYNPTLASVTNSDLTTSFQTFTTFAPIANDSGIFTQTSNAANYAPKLYNGTVWSDTLIDIPGGTIANSTISGGKIANNTITTNLIANNAVVGNLIANGTITGNKISANTITGNLIVANAITTNLISANAVTTIHLLANSVTSDKIVANAITSDKILANAITSDKILANAITTDKLAANSITSINITANAITTIKLAANSITSDKILANAITSDKILANAITSDKIVANAITSDKILANAITSDKILANAITSDKILANSITSDKILANSITSDKIAANSIQTNMLAANIVLSGSIVSNTVAVISSITSGTPASTINFSSTNTANGNFFIDTSGNPTTRVGLESGVKIAFSGVSGLTASFYYAKPITTTSIQIYQSYNETTKVFSSPVSTTGTLSTGAYAKFVYGDTHNPGYWLNPYSGDARFGGNVSIGYNLTVGDLIQSSRLLANTVTTEQLVIGSVYQKKIIHGTPTTTQVAWYNWNDNPKTWRDDTRAFYPSNGVTMIPEFDPKIAGLTVNGTHIEIAFTTSVYATAGTEYNLVEVWKNGAYSTYSGNINTIECSMESFDYNGTTYTANSSSTMVAYGGGSSHQYSTDGGATWNSTSRSKNDPITGVLVWGGRNDNGTVRLARNAYVGAAAYRSTYYYNMGSVAEADDASILNIETRQGAYYYDKNGTLQEVGGGWVIPSANFTGMFKVPQTKRKTRFWARPNGTYVYNIQGLDRLASDPSTLTKDLKSATATKLNPTNSTASVFFAGGIYIIGEGGTLFHPASTGTSGTSGTWASWALSAPTTSAVRYSGTLKDLYCLCSTAPYLTNTNDGDFVVVIVGADGVILRESRTLTTFVLPQLLSAQYREGGTIVVDYYGVSSDSSINSTTSKWVIVGENGIILYSGDNGQTWSQVMSGTAENLRSVTYGNGTWVIVGDNGTILKTQNPSLDYNVTGGWTTVPITFPADASTKVSKNLTHIKYDDTFNTLVISAPSGIYYSSATSYASITFTRKLQIVPSETLNLTRLARYGSPALISSESSTASAVDVQERIINGGIISGTILDVDYSPGQEVQYFLVVGNWKGNPVFVGQTMLSVMEYKV